MVTLSENTQNLGLCFTQEMGPAHFWQFLVSLVIMDSPPLPWREVRVLGGKGRHSLPDPGAPVLPAAALPLAALLHVLRPGLLRGSSDVFSTYCVASPSSRLLGCRCKVPQARRLGNRNAPSHHSEAKDPNQGAGGWAGGGGSLRVHRAFPL